MQRPATSKIKMELPSLIDLPAEIVHEVAADIGGHIANEYVTDALVDPGRTAVVVPAMQDMGNAWVGK